MHANLPESNNNKILSHQVKFTRERNIHEIDNIMIWIQAA